MKVKEFLEKLKPVKNNILPIRVAINMFANMPGSFMFMSIFSLQINHEKKIVYLINRDIEDAESQYKCKELYDKLSEVPKDYEVTFDYYFEAESEYVIINISDFAIDCVEPDFKEGNKMTSFVIYVSATCINGVKYIEKSIESDQN